MNLSDLLYFGKEKICHELLKVFTVFGRLELEAGGWNWSAVREKHCSAGWSWRMELEEWEKEIL